MADLKALVAMAQKQAMQHNGWDHALKVTADGTGLVGHVGAVLLRKAADQAGLTAGLSAALRRKGASPLLDRCCCLAGRVVREALASPVPAPRKTPERASPGRPLAVGSDQHP